MAAAVVEGPASAHLWPLLLVGPPNPNTLVKLKELPEILQEHWALPQSWTSTQAAQSARNALSCFGCLVKPPTLPPRLSSSATSPACLSYCPPPTLV